MSAMALTSLTNQMTLHMMEHQVKSSRSGLIVTKRRSKSAVTLTSTLHTTTATGTTSTAKISSGMTAIGTLREAVAGWKVRAKIGSKATLMASMLATGMVSSTTRNYQEIWT